MLMKLKKFYIFGTWLKFNLTWWRSSIYPEAINSEEQKGVFAELLKSTFLLCILAAILLGKGEKLSHQHMLLLAYHGLKAFLTGPHTARCLCSIARRGNSPLCCFSFYSLPSASKLLFHGSKLVLISAWIQFYLV